VRGELHCERCRSRAEHDGWLLAPPKERYRLQGSERTDAEDR